VVIARQEKGIKTKQKWEYRKARLQLPDMVAFHHFKSRKQDFRLQRRLDYFQ
jgi:hypothetical protein